MDSFQNSHLAPKFCESASLDLRFCCNNVLICNETYLSVKILAPKLRSILLGTLNRARGGLMKSMKNPCSLTYRDDLHPSCAAQHQNPVKLWSVGDCCNRRRGD